MNIGGKTTDVTGIEAQKKSAALHAAREIRDGMVLGLGTGSTVYYLILQLEELIREGLDIHAVATSVKSEELAASHGIPLIPVNTVQTIHLAIDGVDAIGPDFCSIKGGGGALFREKVIASSARRVIWIMDQAKLVTTLSGMVLPIEVSPFACRLVEEQVRKLGFEPALRRMDYAGYGKDAPNRSALQRPAPYITDNGNYILDLKGDSNMDYRLAAAGLKAITGVLETGFFGSICEKIIVGTEHGVTEIPASPL